MLYHPVKPNKYNTEVAEIMSSKFKTVLPEFFSVPGREEDRFVYERVVNSIISLIRDEKYEIGRKLPPIRDLAEQFDCNFHTVRKAVQLLCDDGILEKRSRLGNFVRRNTSHLVGKPQAKVQIVSMRKIGILLCPGPTEFSTPLLMELERAATAMEIQLELQSAANWDKAVEVVEDMKKTGCRAAVLTADRNNLNVKEVHRLFDRSPIPLVVGDLIAGYERFCYEPPEIYGRWYSRNSMLFQCGYFYELGYKAIAYLRRSAFSGSSKDKYGYYREFMEATDHLPILDQFVDDDSGRFSRILKEWEPFRGNLAVICEDDVEAMRLVIAASKNGWTLPEEMAVMGFNNFAFGRYVDPPLTTIQFPYDYLAKRLLVRALELSSGQTEWSAAELPAPEVVLRESCGGRRRLPEDRLRNLVTERLKAKIFPGE